MKTYSAADPSEGRLDFTRSKDPLVRFGGSQTRPLLHFNMAAWEALDLPFRIELSHDRDQNRVVISASKSEKALRSWQVTSYIWAVSAVGFRTWSGIQWPFGQIAAAQVSDGNLEITIPERGDDEALRLRP